MISLLLNRVRLRRGEALYLAAGNIHAYLAGLGIELMAASDNVLRGGLTPKHIDVTELLDVLDFTPIAPPRLEPETVAPGVVAFRPDVPDFVLYRVEPAAMPPSGCRRVVPLDGPAIVLAEGGDAATPRRARRGRPSRAARPLYVTPDEGELEVAGDGHRLDRDDGRRRGIRRLTDAASAGSTDRARRPKRRRYGWAWSAAP